MGEEGFEGRRVDHWYLFRKWRALPMSVFSRHRSSKFPILVVEPCIKHRHLEKVFQSQVPIIIRMEHTSHAKLDVLHFAPVLIWQKA
jgi:hypothetical protein